MSSKEIKRDLLLFAKNNPALFINLANDENVMYYETLLLEHKKLVLLTYLKIKEPLHGDQTVEN